MRQPTRSSIEKELTRLLKKLDYFLKRLEAGKLSNDGYLEKIRPVSRSIDFYRVILAIYDSESYLREMRYLYLALHGLGTPEEFFIMQLNTSDAASIESEMHKYEKVSFDIKCQIVDKLNDFNHSLKSIKLEDFLQENIDHISKNDTDN